MADRYCSNCRAELPENAETCPECGVFAGDVFDERSLRPRTRKSFFVALIVVIAGVAAVSAWLSMPKPEPAPPPKPPPPKTRVVGDRPGGARRAKGAAVTEAEAIRLLRSHLAETTNLANACVVVMSHGASKGGYLLTAYNRCENVRIGRWRVDGKTGDVTLAKGSG